MATGVNTSQGALHLRNVSVGLALLRVVIGCIFLAHGWQKLFVFGFAGVTQAFTSMGVPLPGVTGPLIAILEFFGGVALVLGLLTRPVAAALAIDMLGAIVMLKLGGGFFAPKGYEFELALLAGAAALALTGPGSYSLDHMIAERQRRRGSTA